MSAEQGGEDVDDGFVDVATETEPPAATAATATTSDENGVVAVDEEHRPPPSSSAPPASPGPSYAARARAAAEAGGGSSDDPRRAPPTRKASNLSAPRKTSGLCGASFNLINSIVGAGIIGMPYALKQSGIVAGLLLLALVGFLTDKSLRLIVDLASFHPKLKGRDVRTFEDLASYPFGRFGSNFVLFNMFVMAYGAMVAYLLIIKDTVPTIFGVAHGTEGGIERELILIATSLVVLVPLSMQRDMASLSVTSLFSIFADLILVGFVAGYSPIERTVSDAGGFGEVLKWNVVNPTLFVGLGILSTAMACQHSAFIVSGSLSNGTRGRWSRVTGSSIAIATICCAVLGLCGYLGFLDETQGNVLNNFEKGSVAANGARALLAITMFFTYPMESLVARHVLVMLAHGGDIDGPEGESTGFLCLNRRRSWTILIYVMALVPALIFDDLGPVLSITGAVGGSCVSYVAPGFVHLGANGDAFLDWAYGLLRKRRGDASTDRTAGDVELPVAGDASAKATTTAATTTGEEGGGLELPVAGERRDVVVPPSPESGPKPLWWYLAGFPLWCGVARWGGRNMRTNLAAPPPPPPAPPAAAGNDDDENDYAVGTEGDEEEERTDEEDHGDDLLTPRRRDYVMSMFFILFGVVAAVAGLGSNIYVQINNVFYSF